MRRLAVALLVVITVVGGSSCAPAPTAAPTGRAASTSAATTVLAANATVRYVTDGDTIGVSIGGQNETVRLIGIDTPEVKDPDRPVECYGEAASAFTKQLLPKGTAVHLVRDVEARDKYGRLLAYVYRAEDGLFVNLELARQGYANVLTIPPNVAHAQDFRTAVADARSAGRGLWGGCASFGVPAGG